MKKYCIIIISSFLLFAKAESQIHYNVSTKAQQYVAFPDSNAVWSEYSNGDYQGGPPSHYYRNILDNRDTIISGKIYNQLFYSLIDSIYNNDTTLTYNGGIREANEQIFYLAKDSIHEYLIYDFSKNVGDTIPYNYSIFANQAQYDYAHSFDTLKIFQIDSIMLETGSYRKRFWISDINGIYTGTHWIEGIGSDWGLLVPQYALTTKGGSYNILRCFKQNDTVLYPDSSSYSNCFPLNTRINEVMPSNNRIDIFPNPAIETSIIKWNKDFQFSILEVYDLIGKSVIKTNVSNVLSCTIECDLFKEGIYFIKLSDNKGNFYIKKLFIL